MKWLCRIFGHREVDFYKAVFGFSIPRVYVPFCSRCGKRLDKEVRP